MHTNNKTVLGITLSKLIGLIIFLILLIVANVIQIDNVYYLTFINFLNNNIVIILLLSVLFYLGELFFVFIFPLNLPAPIFNAIGGVILVNFIFRLIYLLGDMLQEGIFYVFAYLEPLIYFIVFCLTILVGYIMIFKDLTRKSQNKKEMKKIKENKKLEKIGREIQETAYTITKNIAESLKPKKKKEAAKKSTKKQKSKKSTKKKKK
ncbi:MAG TPA: hypothetical protein PK357_00655 [Candidatus Pacearchaeota archaeon]|nr:hypothetical protein [Candidatus Pacearchaeota archaeon]